MSDKRKKFLSGQISKAPIPDFNDVLAHFMDTVRYKYVSVHVFSIREHATLGQRALARLLITTGESVLLALLDGELHNDILAERVGVTPQHLTHVLQRLERHNLILSRRLSVRRINRLTSLGRLLAENARQRAEIIAGIESGKLRLDKDETLEVYS